MKYVKALHFSSSILQAQLLSVNIAKVMGVNNNMKKAITITTLLAFLFGMSLTHATKNVFDPDIESNRCF